MKKAEFIFLKKEYTPEDKVGLNYNTQKLRQYMIVLTETHNNMLEILQNPRNEFIRMEENPLHSKDIQFGVPEKFHKMFNEILLDQNNAGEHDENKNKSFVELNKSH